MTLADRPPAMSGRQPLSRRRFLAASALAALACDHAILAAPSTRPKHKYIDIHTHLGAFHFGQTSASKACSPGWTSTTSSRPSMLPLVSPEAAPRLHAMQTSDAAIEAAQAHPDRLIAFCCLDPRVTTTNPQRFGHVNGVRGLAEILRRYKEAGARGFGEHKVGLSFDDPQMMQLYEACRRAGIADPVSSRRSARHRHAGPAPAGECPESVSKTATHRPRLRILVVDFGRRDAGGFWPLSDSTQTDRCRRRARPADGRLSESRTATFPSRGRDCA